MILRYKYTDEQAEDIYGMHGGINRAGTHNAAIDLRATEASTLCTGLIDQVQTGISIELPAWACGLIVPRSGMAMKGVTIVNSPGIIDADYRGELKVLMTLIGTSIGSRYHIEAGDRIAQLLVVEYQRSSPLEVKSLSMTHRGNDGFGSSGKV